MSTQERTSPLVAHLDLPTDCGLRDGCVSAAVYSTLEDEYRCVRASVGISDMCHYGKIKISGGAAQDLVNHVILTDLARLPINQMQTTFLLNGDGSPRCEAFIANYGDHFLILSEGESPANTVAFLQKLAKEKFPDAQITDQTEALGLIGLDGPFAWELLKSFMGMGVIGTRYLEIVSGQAIDDVDFTLARAGKSGEYGYLLWTDAGHIGQLWDKLTALGEKFDMKPLGYQVLDLCKLENRFPSLHNEGVRVDNVLELNTRVLFSREKDEHLGRNAIEACIENGVKKRIIGLTFQDGKEVNTPEVGARISCGGADIGELASVGYSYTLDCWIALALVDDDYAVVGLEYDVDSSGQRRLARTSSAPFVFNRSMQLRPQEDSYFN